MTYVLEIVSSRYVTLSGGMVRVRSGYSMSAKMDVIFDRYCEVSRVAEPVNQYEPKITWDFAFLQESTKDIDVMLDVSVIYLSQDDAIKYTIKKTGRNGSWLG